MQNIVFAEELNTQNAPFEHGFGLHGLPGVAFLITVLVSTQLP